MKHGKLWMGMMLFGSALLASYCSLFFTNTRRSSSTPAASSGNMGSSESSTPASSTPAGSGSSSENQESSQPAVSWDSSIDPDYVAPKVPMQKTYDDVLRNDWYGGSDYTPASGSPKLLIIPIWFTDSDQYISASKKEAVRQDIGTAYLGSAEDVGWESVKTFYQKESGGTLLLQGTLANWYEAGKASTDYAHDIVKDQDVDYASDRVCALEVAASDAYFAAHPEDNRRNYDSDHNGKLDGVMLIYAAPDYASLGNDSYDNLWAYKYENTETQPSLSNPNAGVFFWASYDFLYGSNARARTGFSYAGGDTSHCTLDTHTFIHEMGHMFGLEDYYDYSNQYNPAGGFSMQDCNVGGHDPWSNLALGWGAPYIPSQNCEITIEPYQKNHDLILLSPAWNADDSPFDEYLLLELYTPTGLNELDSNYTYCGGYPRGPRQAGIRLWHVDARLSQWTPQIIDGEQIDTFDPNKHTDPEDGLVGMMCSNTYYKAGSSSNDYLSMLGEDYYNFDLLHLIRDNTAVTNKVLFTGGDLTATDLVGDGAHFDQRTYRKQFVNGEKLDEGTTLGWSFSVDIHGSG
ncbi:MAG: hypothetical protein J6038_00115, partial [Bacilli bacterium]|nr:hypothetical protein [Bacilli bacterium]